MTDIELKRSLLTCPGDSIQEQINHIGMSQAELAERIGRSVPKLNELIKGKAPITKETATKLEYVLGVPASFWLNLERQYQDELLEIEKLEYLEECNDWVSGFPLRVMKRMGIVPNTRDKSKLAECMLKFFRVASPKQWSDIYVGSSLAFKIELRHTSEPQAISVWLRLGELQAESLILEKYNAKAVRNRLDDVQTIAFEHSKTWKEKLQQVCSSCGIALVYTPCISKAPIYGATRWIKNNTIPLIQITDRRKDNNAFWFTFYHELAHILYHGKKDIFIDGLNSIKPNKQKEAEADAFASRMLLSDRERNELSKYPSFNVNLVLDISNRIKKHPGIIVAQLQRNGVVAYNDEKLNRLKARVDFREFILA